MNLHTSSQPKNCGSGSSKKLQLHRLRNTDCECYVTGKMADMISVPAGLDKDAVFATVVAKRGYYWLT
jgi:hypothetical protein